MPHRTLERKTAHEEGDNLFFKFDCSIDESKRLHFEFWFINLGLLSCYVVCGLIIAALGASIQDVAKNVDRKSTDIASIFVARGIGSIFGSFISAPIFTEFNAVKSLILTYVATVVVLLWIPFIDSLTQLHIAYFLIGTVTSIISSGSILLLRKIHMDKAGPWLGALGAALVSAGMIVPCVQMLVNTMMAQFCLYCIIIIVAAIWLRMLPCMREDVYAPYRGEEMSCLRKMSCFFLGDRETPDLSLSPRMNGRVRPGYGPQKPAQLSSQPLQQSHQPVPAHTSVNFQQQHETPGNENKSLFFMTPVASASNCSSSSFYTSACKELSNFTKSQQDLAAMISGNSDSVACIPHSKSHPNYHSMESGEVGVGVGVDIDIDDVTQENPTDEEEAFLLESILAADPPHYWSDMTISLMILFIIGGSNAFSIYIETYVDDTGILPSQWKAMVLMLFFGAGTVANIIGIFIQMDIGDRRLSQVTAAVLVGGAVGMMLVIGWPEDTTALWIGVTLYGFASAVTVGFCFNIANRLSYPSAKSTSIIMMGSSIGVSLIPYLSSVVYKWYHSPLTIMYFALVSMLVPIVLLYVAPKFSYLRHIHKF